MKSAGAGKTISEFLNQLYQQCRDNSLTVVCPLFFQNILPDTVADLSVKNGKAGVNSNGNILPRSFYEPADITN